MLKQGAIPFSYEGQPTESGITAFAGLPAYLELAVVAKLADSVRGHLEDCRLEQQSWTDNRIIMSLILLNIAGGDWVDDLPILEGQEGLVKFLRRVGFSGQPRKVRILSIWMPVSWKPTGKTASSAIRAARHTNRCRYSGLKRI